MKILLLNQEHAHFSGPGGAERSVQSIAEHFSATGHKPTFVAMTRKVYQRDMPESGIHSIRDINGVRTIMVGKMSPHVTHADLLLPVILAEQPDIIHTNVFHRAPQLWQALAPLGIPVLLLERDIASEWPVYQDLFAMLQAGGYRTIRFDVTESLDDPDALGDLLKTIASAGAVITADETLAALAAIPKAPVVFAAGSTSGEILRELSPIVAFVSAGGAACGDKT